MRTPRIAYSAFGERQTSIENLFQALGGPGTFSCWANDSCGTHLRIDPKDSPLSFETRQNLVAIWGVYEKEIGNFNHASATYSIGDTAQWGSQFDVRTDPHGCHTAFLTKLYAVQSLAELHTLVDASQIRVKKRVNFIVSIEQISSKYMTVFGKLGDANLTWSVLSLWCTFVCTLVRYAHLMAGEDVTFSLHGEAHLEDLLEMIDLPLSYRKAILSRAGEAKTKGQPASSQGGRRDRPPSVWIRSELEAFWAIGPPKNLRAQQENIRPVKSPDLAGDIHPIFSLDCWGNYLDHQQWADLRPTFILCTCLLPLALPWFAAFLPQASCGVTNGANPATGTVHIPLTRKFSQEVRLQVERNLQDMAQHITWDFKKNLLSQKGRFSQTHRGDFENETGLPADQAVDDHIRNDHRERHVLKLPRRTTFITVDMRLMAVALNAQPGTEHKLFAVFFLAVVLISELGHAAWLMNFNNRPFGDIRVGNDVHCNLANSLIGCIFGGWYPKPNYLDDSKLYSPVEQGLNWNKLFQRPMQRPLYATAYSVSVPHIQRILSQGDWRRVIHAEKPTAAVRALLRPETPFQQRHTARIAHKIENHDYWAADWGEGVGEANYYEDADWEVTPPPAWDSSDLIAAGAVGCSVVRPTLTEKIHPIFAYENWTRARADLKATQSAEDPSLTREEYARLEPAIRLATLLLKVGIPWFTSLLPNIKWHGGKKDAQDTISAVQSYGPDDLAATRTAFDNLAGHIHFDHNPRQFPERGYLGWTTRGHRSSQDADGNFMYRDVGIGEHLDLDQLEKARNFRYRRVQISLSSQVITAVLDFAPDSEEYLQALYSLATTLAHEMAHAARFANFQSLLGGYEQIVHGEAVRELGISLMAWINGGWQIADDPELDDQGRATYRNGCSWYKRYKYLPWNVPLPRYRTYYSIPVHHIQRQFMQASWDIFDLDRRPEEAADVLLRPLTPFHKGEHARKVVETSNTFRKSKGGQLNKWWEGDEPDEADERVNPRYEDPEWDDNPVLPG